ncbi:PRD domain-containing protein [Bacillaceae bacterium S4-13-58]
MNERQKKILQLFLLSPKQNFLVQDIADYIQVSEKTIRNDFKEIDEWLKDNSTASLVRKRSKGVYTELTEEERKRLMNELNIVDLMEESFGEEKLLEILMLILNKNKTFTIQELAERCFVSKTVIKKDLRTIEQFLIPFRLKITIKKKIGILVEGDELNRRNALFRLLEMSMGKQSNFNSIMSNLFVSHEYIFVKRQVMKINDRLPLALNDEALNNVIFHILIMVQRIKLKNQINLSSEEMKEVRDKQEYELAVELLKSIESFFSVKFPEKEITYIALRILGGKRQSPNSTVNVPFEMDDHVGKFINKLIDRVSKISNIHFGTDKQLYSGLSIHLHSTFHRLRYQLSVSNPMVNDIKKMYPYMFETIFSVISKMGDPVFSKMLEDEIAFITLHFQSSLERLNKINGKNKRVLIVCSMGIGMSQLLCAKLERRFNSLNIEGCIPLSQLNQVNNFNDIDFIITTEPVKTKIPSVQISPLFFDYEQKKIEYFIKKLEEDIVLTSLKDLLKEEFIFLRLDVEHRYEIIEKITTELYKKGMVKKEYIKSALDREKTSSTAIGGGLAIPHGSPDHVITPVIAVATLSKPIEWESEKVTMIFLLGNKFADSKTTKTLFEDLSHLSENYDLIQKLTSQTDKGSFLSLFEEPVG